MCSKKCNEFLGGKIVLVLLILFAGSAIASVVCGFLYESLNIRGQVIAIWLLGSATPGVILGVLVLRTSAKSRTNETAEV